MNLQQNATPSKRKPSIYVIFLNLLLVLAVVVLGYFLFHNMENQKTVAAMQTTIEEQQQQLQVENIPLSTFQENAQRFNVSAEFLQSFFTDKIVYKDTSGIVYADIDESLPKNQLDWGNLVSVNGRWEYQVNGKKTGKVGIDVSKHQGDIDWQKVKADGIDFAILRIGYRGYETGKILLDETYLQNVKQASEAGMDIGVYFYSQAVSTEEALEEAQLVIENLKGYKITYPVILDIEDAPSDTARTANMTAAQNTDMAITFCEAVKDAGYTPMVYANTKWFLSRLELSRLTEYGKWLAQYYSTPFYPYDLDIWQYSATGKVDGISGNVDMNVSFTDFSSGADTTTE